MQVRAIRCGHGLTQKQLSDMAGISQANISDIENNRISPTVQTAAKIAVALGCTIDELMSGTDHASSISQERR